VRLSLVVAVAANGVIGRAGALPWRIADDLKWFRQRTIGKPIVMGRKTFDSIGQPLKGRANIVVSRRGRAIDGAILARSIDDALAIARLEAEKLGAEEICVIGGGEIYAQTLAIADRIYLTEVDAVAEGEARFPALDDRDWRRTAAGGADQSDRNEHSCRFFILDRRAESAGVS
jgi:dihydrofolate reductase